MSDDAAKPQGDESKAAADAAKPVDNLQEAKPADAVKPDAKIAEGEKAKPDSKEATDAKAAESKEADGDKPAGDETQIPEKYELKLPENSLLSEDYVTELSEYAKTQKLSAAQAQALLDREHNAAQAGVEAMQSNAKKMSEKWLVDAKADKEIGGEHFPETVRVANDALEKLFPDLEIRKFMDSTGLGNHPTVLRGFAKIGRMLQDDTIERGTQPPRSTTRTQRLYDNPTSPKS